MKQVQTRIINYAYMQTSRSIETALGVQIPRLYSHPVHDKIYRELFWVIHDSIEIEIKNNIADHLDGLFS